MRALTKEQALATFDEEPTGQPSAQVLEGCGAAVELAASTRHTLCETGELPQSIDHEQH